MAPSVRSPLSTGLDVDASSELRVGYVYAAVGICSVAAYPIGALFLESKCGWSCVPTVSDVERPLTGLTEVWNVDILRRVLVSLAVFLRVALVPTILLQVFPLLKPPSCKEHTLKFLKLVFYASLAIWVASDFFQAATGNDLKHRADYTPHTLAIHIDIISLIICHIVLLIALYNDSESRRLFVAAGSFALLKVAAASLFLAVRLSTTSYMWQLVEWAMLFTMAGLQVCIGMAIPSGFKLDARRFKVSRLDSSLALIGSSCTTQTWGSLSISPPVS